MPFMSLLLTSIIRNSLSFFFPADNTAYQDGGNNNPITQGTCNLHMNKRNVLIFHNSRMSCKTVDL